jgi:S-DNA-T family DNA segregation ATPase FtsK/SpoIIIE
VIVADEMADLMMTSGKEVEQHIIRLAQKSRAVGIHLILATQKPTVDVITGLIKSNLPARIAFQVASRTDSRVVLDEMGADKLLGNGDMLFLWPGTSTLLRGQGTYLSDEEINEIVDHCSRGEQNFVQELVNIKVKDPEEEEGAAKPGPLKKRDELYESAVDLVVREGRGSVSLLQRALGIGYGRAARLIDFMAEDGIVGQYNGSQAREILISLDDWERMQGLAAAEAAGESTSPVAARRNRVRPEPWEEPPEDDAEESELGATTLAQADDEEDTDDYRAESA